MVGRSVGEGLGEGHERVLELGQGGVQTRAGRVRVVRGQRSDQTFRGFDSALDHRCRPGRAARRGSVFYVHGI